MAGDFALWDLTEPILWIIVGMMGPTALACFKCASKKAKWMVETIQNERPAPKFYIKQSLQFEYRIERTENIRNLDREMSRAELEQEGSEFRLFCEDVWEALGRQTAESRFRQVYRYPWNSFPTLGEQFEGVLNGLLNWWEDAWVEGGRIAWNELKSELDKTDNSDVLWGIRSIFWFCSNQVGPLQYGGWNIWLASLGLSLDELVQAVLIMSPGDWDNTLHDLIPQAQTVDQRIPAIFKGFRAMSAYPVSRFDERADMDLNLLGACGRTRGRMLFVCMNRCSLSFWTVDLRPKQ